MDEGCLWVPEEPERDNILDHNYKIVFELRPLEAWEDKAELYCEFLSLI